MRELWARAIALLTGGLVVALAAVFAYHQNPAGAPRAPAAPPSPLIETGRAVYAAQGCARCHAIAGQGNPRAPLDGVGARLGEPALRRWITPHAAPGGDFQARHANIALTAAERDALTAYLRSLQ